MPMRTIPGAMRQRWWMESGLDEAAAHLMGGSITGWAVESSVRVKRQASKRQASRVQSPESRVQSPRLAAWDEEGVETG